MTKLLAIAALLLVAAILAGCELFFPSAYVMSKVEKAAGVPGENVCFVLQNPPELQGAYCVVRLYGE